MNLKEVVKYFHEQIFSNNLTNEIENYVDAKVSNIKLVI